jgi:hypothetical protein
MITPAEDVYKSIVNLKLNPQSREMFKIVTTFLRDCIADEHIQTPNLKDDVLMRWNQGHLQVLSSILKIIDEAEDKLRGLATRNVQSK